MTFPSRFGEQNPETHKITDFFSFYTLPSTIMNHQKHHLLEAAYLFYYATDVAFQEDADANGLLKRRLRDLIGDAIIVADQAKFDVFNALTLMDSAYYLQDLKASTPPSSYITRLECLPTFMILHSSGPATVCSTSTCTTGGQNPWRVSPVPQTRRQEGGSA